MGCSPCAGLDGAEKPPGAKLGVLGGGWWWLAGASLQAVLRFLILCTRMECRKCQGRAGSITAGYDVSEDAEAMRKFLLEFTCESLRGASSNRAGGVKRRAPAPNRKVAAKKAKDAGK